MLANQAGANAAALVLIGCLLATMAIWILQKPGKSARYFAAVFGFCSLYLPFSSAFAIDADVKKEKAGTVAFSQETLQQHLNNGDSVFVDMTADWCITCLANEARVLNTDAVQQAFDDNNVVFMIGDWTDYDSEITEYLNQYGRNGIPLYVYLPPKGRKEHAVVLPQILDADSVIALVSTP